MIKFKNIKKSYGKKVVIENLNMEIEDGEFILLIGPSGCGKTTTLKMINRLIEPDSGQIIVNGQDVSKIDKVKLRRSIGYVIQEIGLFPNMTVAENIAVVPKLLKYDKKEYDKIVREMLELVEMPYEEYANKYPSELSGGQQQRIGVLRALAASPPIILMDEPFGALDPMTRTILQDEIKQLQQKLGKTVVFVTHDMDEALNLADRIVFMDKGEIIQMATPEEILEEPASELIKSFMGKRSENKDVELTAGDFLQSKITTVKKDKGIRASIDLMARKNVDTLIVLDDDDTYLGVVSIKRLRNRDESNKKIGELLEEDNIKAYIDDDAEESFEELISSGQSYVVILNRDNTVAGIVTKTSMAKAMVHALWG